MEYFVLLGYLSSGPRNLNYTYKVQQGVRNVVLANFTWDAPEFTHGAILNYKVEYITNDTTNGTSSSITSDVVSVSTKQLAKIAISMYVI